ncbi:MAG: hypothetical protein M1402_01150 [Candidatus Thermoplasmatota archaeon]|nr:hypothetical protein [Candidatus Thermoplasmatota archaeon]
MDEESVRSELCGILDYVRLAEDHSFSLFEVVCGEASSMRPIMSSSSIVSFL